MDQSNSHPSPANRLGDPAPCAAGQCSLTLDKHCLCPSTQPDEEPDSLELSHDTPSPPASPHEPSEATPKSAFPDFSVFLAAHQLLELTGKKARSLPNGVCQLPRYRFLNRMTGSSREANEEERARESERKESQCIEHGGASLNDGGASLSDGGTCQSDGGASLSEGCTVDTCEVKNTLMDGANECSSENGTPEKMCSDLVSSVPDESLEAAIANGRDEQIHEDESVKSNKSEKLEAMEVEEVPRPLPVREGSPEKEELRPCTSNHLHSNDRGSPSGTSEAAGLSLTGTGSSQTVATSSQCHFSECRVHSHECACVY